MKHFVLDLVSSFKGFFCLTPNRPSKVTSEAFVLGAACLGVGASGKDWSSREGRWGFCCGFSFIWFFNDWFGWQFGWRFSNEIGVCLFDASAGLVAISF